MSKKRKIRIVEHRFLPDGNFAYYDRGRDQIHILNKDAMYRRVLRHELAHSRWGFWARNSDKLIQIIALPVTRIIFFVLATGYLGYVLLSRFTPLFGIDLLLGFAFALAVLFILGQAFYWTEEFTAERQAKMGRKPRTKSKAKVIRQSSHPEHSQQPDTPLQTQSPSTADSSTA